MTATVLKNSEASRGSRWLALQLPEGALMDFAPGTVLGLMMKHGAGTLRHAYTVSRADSRKRSLEFLYRVIPDGKMTPHLAALEPGAEVTIAGRGGHPISGEVATNPEGIVLVSTGTGIGPIWGYAQSALEGGLRLPLTLVAGFRELQDACLQDELKSMAEKFPNFRWHFTLTKPDADWMGLKGRVTEVLPAVLGPVGKLHFHLVGNGAMVVELYHVLMLAGLKDERVTSEIYFNWADDVDPEMLKKNASKFRL